MSEVDRNLWFGPMILVVWGVVGYLFGSSYPTEFYNVGDLIFEASEFFSYVGGLWFLIILLVAAVAAVTTGNKWVRYFLGALMLAHVILYASTEVGWGININEDSGYFTTTRFRFFANDIRDAVLYEIIPIFGALTTVSTDFAGATRRFLRRATIAVTTGMRKVTASVSSPISTSSDTNEIANRAANRALRASRIIEIFGGITVVLGLVAGVILVVAGFATESCDVFGEDCGTNFYSIILGVGVALASLVQGAFFIMIGAYVASRSARNE